MRSVRRLTPLQLDAAIAVAVALIAIIATPGLAITALLALLVLLACGITLLAGRLRGRRRRNSGGPRGGHRRPVGTVRSSRTLDSAPVTSMPRAGSPSRKPRSRRREPPVRRVPPGRI